MFLLFLLIFIIIILVNSIRIVPEATTCVIERLGTFHDIWEAGLHFKVPIIDKVRRTVSMREQVADYEPTNCITSDNVTMKVDSVVYFQIFDSKSFTYGVERPMAAIENLTATTLRNVIGSLTLDQTLTSRDIINQRITAAIDEATDKWGIKVNRVEVKNIIPPANIREAMEKQMRAEREKREAILKAEGSKQAAITEAEGEKESAILRADAVRERKVREAEGEAEALLKIYEAQAKGIAMINEAKPSEEYLKLQSFDTLAKVADGQATKLIVPSEIQNLATLISSAKISAEK